MLKLHAFLNRKPSSLLPPPCQVEAVVELDAVSFENLLQRPMDDQPQITAHKSLMRCEEGVEHCVLFLGEGSQDGVLVNSEGYDWARYAAFIPGARMIANSHLEQGISLSAARIGGRPAGNGGGQRTPHCAAALQAGRGNQHDDECAGGRYGDQRGGSPAASRQMCPGGQADQRQYLPQGRGEIPKGAGIGGD